jgi:CDP-diacylglycerol--glycerol-3-phosphate 3-phosphatidyltransferase
MQQVETAVSGSRAGTIANGLSRLRLVLAPVLLGLAWFQFRDVYFWTLLFALSTDAADGYIARRWGQVSPRGAQIDSRADLAIILSVPFGLWLLFPDLMRRHAGVVISLVGVHLLTHALGVLKWRRLTSYHTWGTKAAAVLLAATVLLLFWVDQIEWVLYPAVIVAALSYVDEILITFTLRQWQSDVPTWWHAKRRMLVET